MNLLFHDFLLVISSFKEIIQNYEEKTENYPCNVITQLTTAVALSFQLYSLVFWWKSYEIQASNLAMAVLAMNRSYNLKKFKKAKLRRLFRKRRGCWYRPVLLHLRSLDEFIPPTWAGSLKCVHMGNFHPTKVRSHRHGSEISPRWDSPPPI